jgi:Flp pilus assembly secretin CpaC
LVIIVTPRLVKPLPPGPPELPTDRFIEPDAAEFFLLGSLEGNAWSRFSDSTKSAFGVDSGTTTGTSFDPLAGDLLVDGLAGDAGHRLDVGLAEAEL